MYAYLRPLLVGCVSVVLVLASRVGVGLETASAMEVEKVMQSDEVHLFDGGGLSAIEKLRDSVKRVVEAHSRDDRAALPADEYVAEYMRDFDQYRILLIDVIQVVEEKGERKAQFAHQRLPTIVVYQKDGVALPADGEAADAPEARPSFTVNVQVLKPVVFSAKKKSFAAKITVDGDGWSVSGLAEFELAVGDGTKFEKRRGLTKGME